MDFRWAAGIALWTLLSGPVFVGVQQFVPRAPASKASYLAPVPTQTGKTPTHRDGQR